MQDLKQYHEHVGSVPVRHHKAAFSPSAVVSKSDFEGKKQPINSPAQNYAVAY